MFWRLNLEQETNLTFERKDKILGTELILTVMNLLIFRSSTFLVRRIRICKNTRIHGSGSQKNLVKTIMNLKLKFK